MDIGQRKNAPHHHRRQIKVNRIKTKDHNSAVHTFTRENTQGATDVHPNAEISGNTKMLLHQPQLKQMISGNNNSLMASPVDRHT